MAKRKKMGVKLLGWLVLVIVAGSVAVTFVIQEEVVKVTAAPVERGHVEQTVTAIASGTVRPKMDAMVASEFMGKVVAVRVEDGQRVEAGTVLVELNHDDLDAHVRLAEANLRAGQARLQQVQLAAQISEDVAVSRVSQSEAQRSQAKSDFERLKKLADKSIIPQMDLDQASLALTVAQEAEASAVASARQSEVRREEIRSAEAALEQLQAAVDVAKAQCAKAFVCAPFAGVVAKVHVDLGEAVTPGIPVLQLVDDSACYVEAPFDEANDADIQVGQTARITLDAYRGRNFSGTIEYIPPVVALNPDLSRTLNVRVRVDDSAEVFVAGMSADVVILVDQKDDTLFVPTEALIREQSAFIIENGIAVQREVTLGIGNWHTREVLDGLAEGDTLITSVGLQELRDGVHVQIVTALEAS
jgi:HlyD family secretion protein